MRIFPDGGSAGRVLMRRACLLLLPLALLGLSLPTPGQAQFGLRVKSMGEGTKPDRTGTTPDYCQAMSFGPRVEAYWQGTKAALMDRWNNKTTSWIMVPYQFSVDGVSRPCNFPDGVCRMDFHTPSYETPEGQGEYLVSVPSAIVTKEAFPHAFTTGTHTFTLSIPSWGLSASQQYTLACGGDAPPTVVTPKAVEYTLTVETNPSTGKPYTGMSADTIAPLMMVLDVPGARSASVQTRLGRFRDARGRDLSGGVIPLSGRPDTLYYLPPAYLEDRFLGLPDQSFARTSATVPPPGWIVDPLVTKDSVIFSIVDPTGEVREAGRILTLIRPPIFFVHGFLGNHTTWDGFVVQRRFSGFPMRADDFYATEDGVQDVAAQSNRLRQVMASELEVFAHFGLKVPRGDLVAHSMGGLISRHLIQRNPGYQRNVRKLITIATPHAGIEGPIDNAIGYWAAWWDGVHEGMKQDVDYESLFLALLNDGVGSGLHLNPAVQYGNIFGRGDDGVVEDTSARLNGVHEFEVQAAVRHSPSVPGIVSPILEWEPVLDTLKAWLLEDLHPVPLSTLHAEVTLPSIRALVSQQEPDAQGLPAWVDRPVNSLPTYLEVGSRVKSTNARAVVRYVLNGHTLAQVALERNSEVGIAPMSPTSLKVVMVKGKGVFKTFYTPIARKPSFQLDLVPGDDGPRLFDLMPRASLRSFGTEFAVEVLPGGGSQIHLLEGELEVRDIKGTEPQPLRMNPGETLGLSAVAPPQSLAPPQDPWWEGVRLWAEAPAEPVQTTNPPAASGPPPTGNQPPGGANPPSPALATLETVGMEGFFLIDTYPSDLNALQGALTSRMGSGYAPVGLSMRRGKIDVLYLGGGVLPVTEWTMDGHTSTDELGAGITQRMNEGFLPTGLAWDNGTYWVLYLKTDLVGTAWQIVVSDVNLDAVQRDLAPWLQQGFVPFDVTLAEGRYMTLLVNLSEEMARQWSLQGTLPGGLKDLIEGQMLDGFFPWGLLYDEVANVLFLAF